MSKEAPPLPPMGALGFLRFAWRQLTSMKTALILLFLLAIASVPGSIFPQRGNNPLRVNEWIADSPTFGPIFDTLGFFDVYSSPWFAAVYLLLFISLIGCVLPRTKVHWRAMFAPPPPVPRNLLRLPESMSFEVGAPAHDVLARGQKYLTDRRWRLLVTENAIAAEKGFLRETGNLLFHFSLILILVAIAVGGLFGWKGNVIVRAGQGFSNTLTQYDAWGGGRFTGAARLSPFSFTLDKFNVEFDRSEAQRGSPSLFEADVTYRRSPGAVAENSRIEVNSPLEIDGAKVFLVGHGYAPHFVVRDASGAVVFDDSVVFLPQDGNFTSTGVVKIPDSEPPLGIEGIFVPTAASNNLRGPISIFPGPDDPAVFMSAWRGDLGLDAGAPQSVYRLDTKAMAQIGLDALRPGQTWVLPDGSGSIEVTGFERWASFQIAFDPGKEIALLGAILALTGLMLSLFIRRRRVWIAVAPSSQTVTVVQIAGLARIESADLPGELQLIREAVAGLADTTSATPLGDFKEQK
ncbi:MAG: cytochrome c biogenesis protein ResB [Candidatus Nanopelagicales bacterium]|nr:cytochrome c biogenesis protein ResB [Candidatus Nanopelagicales bacterium]